MIDKSTTVKATEMALCLGIQKSQLSDLVKKGIVAKAGRSDYLLLESLTNHRQWIQGGNSTDNDGNVIDFYVERARKTKAEADALERKNRIADGEYMAISEMCTEISIATGICSKILGAFKINIARISPEIPNRTLDLIERESAKCMSAIVELDETYCKRVNEIDKVV